MKTKLIFKKKTSFIETQLLSKYKNNNCVLLQFHRWTNFKKNLYKNYERSEINWKTINQGRQWCQWRRWSNEDDEVMKMMN